MKKSLFVLTSILIIAFSSLAQAQLMCSQLFEIKKVDARQNRPATAKFTANKTVLNKISPLLPDARKRALDHLISATEFFDYAHMSDLLISKYVNDSSKKIDFTDLYNEKGFLASGGQPFKSFLKARQYLNEQKPEVNLDLIRKIHEIVMDGNVEGVSESQLGDMRDGHWYGNVPKSEPISKAEVANLESNPYLTFEAIGQVGSESKLAKLQSAIQFWGKVEKAPQAQEAMSYGAIHYPNILKSKQATIDLIQASHPELYKSIQLIRKNQSEGKVYDYFSSPDLKRLESEMTKALTENRFKQFQAESQALGAIKIGKNERQYIHLVADFQRDLVSIHPVNNGNGRTTRLLMNYLLTKVGLPAARLVDPAMDIQLSSTEWKAAVEQGVINSAKLYADFKERIQNGLTLENSPELLFPGLIEKVEIQFKKQGSDKVYLGSEPVKVNSEQFTAFMSELLKNNSQLSSALKSAPVDTMQMISEMFIDFYKSKTIEYFHEKDGRSVIKLRFVEADFIDMFGAIRAPSKALWNYKMDRWYDKDMLVWRGLSGRNEVGQNEILSYFIQPSTRIASNAAVTATGRGQNLKSAIMKDFEQYNQELLSGKLIEMADDHHKEGARYSSSYGFSTSKREVVGKAFAMGAMVIAEYGKQNDPELQKQLKSRINIASYRAEKDVDLGRLKAFDSKFSYIYGRQAEVMAIGGTDPDAVMAIQRIDAAGTVTETYYRNPELPSEILLISGRYVPEMGAIPKDQITARFYINADKAGQISVNTTVTAENQQVLKETKLPKEVDSPKKESSPGSTIIDWFKKLF